MTLYKSRIQLDNMNITIEDNGYTITKECESIDEYFNATDMIAVMLYGDKQACKYGGRGFDVMQNKGAIKAVL